MKVKCFSVRLESMTPISSVCWKAKTFDGSEAFIPSSQVYGQDYEVQKSEAWWISEWILEKKELQYSKKKEAWFDRDTGQMLPSYTVVKHIPKVVEPQSFSPDEALTR